MRERRERELLDAGEDYVPIIDLARTEPTTASHVGLYRTGGVEGPDELLAFALGINNVDHAAHARGFSGGDSTPRVGRRRGR